MLNRITKRRHKSRQAFTLVEIIVVLVILAVIASVTVPALTGYIKRTKREKYYESAHYALNAAQSVMVEYYGLGYVAKTGQVNKKANETEDGKAETGGGGSAGDIRWDAGVNARNTDEMMAWGEKVLALMDCDRSNEPYLLIFGTGRPDSGLPESDLYTIYYIAYVADEHSPAVFYINGEWRYKYPTDNPKAIIKEGNINYLCVNGKKDKALQFYVVSNNTGISDNFWTSGDKRSLKSHSEPQFKG